MAESTIAAPPPAPSPNAAPAAPAPAAAPAPTERNPTDWMGGAENDFADMAANKEPEAPPPAAKKVDPVKPDEPVEKPADAPKDDIDPAAAEPVKPVKAAELRTAYEGLKKRVKEEYEPQLQSLKSKIQELESRKPEDTAPVIAKMTALEKRNQELEKQIEFVDYTKSNEYVSKYQQPFADAWQRAVGVFGQLEVSQKIEDGVDEMGDIKFTETRRTADANDLLELSRMPIGKMDSTAKAMFGDSAARAISYVEKVQELWQAKQRGEQEAATKATEVRAMQTLESQKHEQALSNTWNEINKSLEEKFPKAFQVDKLDADDVASHTKGFALADLLFLGNGALTPEQKEALPQGFRETVKAGQPLSAEQKVQLHALARIKMANHDRKVVQLKKATARIAELEKSLAEYEQSEPPAGKSGSGAKAGDKPWDEQVADELKALDRR